MNDQSNNSMLKGALGAAWAVMSWLADVAAWCGDNAGTLLVVITPVAVAAGLLHQFLTRRALALRTRYILTPSRRFDPSTEDIWRQTALLMRAAGKGPWWAPRGARRVRVRLRADGSVPLEYSVEGPKAAATLLTDSRFQEVSVAEAEEAADPVAAQAAQDRLDKKDKELQRRLKAEAKDARAKAKASGKNGKVALEKQKKEKEKDGRLVAVRAEFVLKGRPSAALRDVPMTPDPLQPLIDAVSDIRAEQGDLAEVVLDVQSIPLWQVKLRRWKLMHEAQEDSRKAARRNARNAALVAADAEDSLRYQLLSLLDPSSKSSAGSRMPTPRPRAVEPEEALGRLHSNTGLVRIQLLVRCASQSEGRARQLLERVSAGLDVFGQDSRLGVDGGRFLKWSWGADSWHRRDSFDRRWSSGQVGPREQNWLHVSELAGLFKPPTMHAVLPVLASELPDYVAGEALVPHGRLVHADGTSRVIATREEEFLFSVNVGKSNYGKTETALTRAIAVAAAGSGAMFVDPHGDSWTTASPYLAHPVFASRVRRIDLARADQPEAKLPNWNMLEMKPGRKANRLTTATVDALATGLNWTDAAAPRALTIFTKSIEALVAHNARAVAADRPDAQATLLQIRTLLTDKPWRDALIKHLSPEQRRWWTTTFAAYQVAEVLGPVLNPIDRLASNEVTRAFLGSPQGTYDIREAMDEGYIVWLCLEGTGPSDRLLFSMVLQNLLQAGLSRRDLASEARKWFHTFADELIALDPAGGPSFAAISEQLRKFGGRLHVMTQSLGRISPATKEALMQNSSVVSTTSGSMTAARAMAEEWHGAVSAGQIADLPRFSHYVQVTADGNRVGPLRVQGVQVSELFGMYHRPKLVGEMVEKADEQMGSRTLPELLSVADAQDAVLLEFNGPEPDPSGGTGKQSDASPGDGGATAAQQQPVEDGATVTVVHHQAGARHGRRGPGRPKRR
ncbi:ATP/GTP-binding protein [Kitasatospora sp. NPDC049285]|uniref:ATP/GTP-binding protein n=1 Tax=Kitasatospora sp. NPDC049285 TaxID=3157096 RepID=UPI00342320DB